jgi:dihydroflavonol-4-reductase
VQQGYRIRALRRGNTIPFFIPANVFSQVEWVQGDILDTSVLENAMDGADAVIHCAAKVSFVAADHLSMLKTNIEGTANVVNAALLKNIKRLVHISSVAALGRTSNGETVTEKKEWEDSRINTMQRWKCGAVSAKG